MDCSRHYQEPKPFFGGFGHGSWSKIPITMGANMHAVLIFGGDKRIWNHELFWDGGMSLGVFFGEEAI